MPNVKSSLQNTLLEDGVAYLHHWIGLGRTTGFHWLKESCQTQEWDEMAVYFKAKKALGPALWMQQISTSARLSKAAFDEILVLLTHWLNLFREKETLCSSCQNLLMQGWGQSGPKGKKKTSNGLILGPKTPLSPCEKDRIDWAFSAENGIFPVKRNVYHRKDDPATPWHESLDQEFSLWLDTPSQPLVFHSWEAAYQFFKTPTCCAMSHWQMVFFMANMRPSSYEKGVWVDTQEQGYQTQLSLEEWGKWIWLTDGQPSTLGFEKTGHQIRCLGGKMGNQWHRL